MTFTPMRGVLAALLLAVLPLPAAAGENDHACEVIQRECGYDVPEERELCDILTSDLGCLDATSSDGEVTAPEASPAPLPADDPPPYTPLDTGPAPAADPYYDSGAGASPSECPEGQELYDVLTCSCMGDAEPIQGSGSCSPCSEVGSRQECR